MTFELFITILVMSATATSVAVQIIKSILEKAGVTYKSVPIAVITGFIVGVLEMAVYYTSHNIAGAASVILYSLCMGIANAAGATTSYDLVKKFVGALHNNPE